MHAISRPLLSLSIALATFTCYAWDLTTEVVIKHASDALKVESSSKAIVSSTAQEISIAITSTFYSAGKFTQPWLTLPTNGSATLHIATEKKSWPFSSKEEMTRQLTVQIGRSRLPSGTLIYIYNDDIGEVIAHAIAK